MFWKLILLALLAWGAAMYFSVTLGGVIHVVPIAVVALVVMRRMAKQPNTEFGRWRSRDTRRRD